MKPPVVVKRTPSSPLLHQSSSSASFATAIEEPILPLPSRNINTGEPSQSNDERSATGENSQDRRYTIHPGIYIFFIFLGYLFLLYCVYLYFPRMQPKEKVHIKLPRTMKQAKSLAAVLARYTKQYYWTVLFGFAVVYLFLQTFAVPGSIFLSIMSGFLFPFWTALLTVCFCSACGASGCYMISWLVARSLVEEHFTELIQHWRTKVNEERDNLLNFILFLRVTPILPNWLINVVSPHIGVPLGVFWLGSFLGVAPPTALAVQAGRTLNMMTSPSDHISWGSMALLVLIGLCALLPVLVRRYLS